MNKEEYKKLEKIWYKKLRDSGFQDVESEIHQYRSKHVTLKTRKKYENYEDFYSVLSYYAWHPTLLIPTSENKGFTRHGSTGMKEFFKIYADNRNLPASCAEYGHGIAPSGVRNYIKKHIKLLLKWYNEGVLDDE